MHHGVQAMGEGMRSEIPLMIFSGTSYATAHQGAMFVFLPELDNLQDGGFVLMEKMTFSIRKSVMPTALAKRTRIRCSLKGLEGKTYIIENVKQPTGDHIAWMFEARRDEGGDA